MKFLLIALTLLLRFRMSKAVLDWNAKLPADAGDPKFK